MTDETPIELARFLASTPPGLERNVMFPGKVIKGLHGGVSGTLEWPEIRLYCDSKECLGHRTFREKYGHRFDFEALKYGATSEEVFVSYLCGDCRSSDKTFALRLTLLLAAESFVGMAFKFGEDPPFGDPPPAELLSLLDSGDRELFARGLHCENQGFGIGAFAYYRRVVESEKDRILARVIEVGRKLDIDAATLEKLESAKGSWRFAKGADELDSAAPEIPARFQISGQNPLRLLHQAFSEGLHRFNDEDCLKRAIAARQVLSAFAKKLDTLLAEDAILHAAVEKLGGRPDADTSRKPRK